MPTPLRADLEAVWPTNKRMRRMMWKLRSPDDLEGEASRGGAHKLQTWSRGTFFCPLTLFPIATKKMVFAQRFFMDKNDRSNIFCCILQLVMNKYCFNQLMAIFYHPCWAGLVHAQTMFQCFQVWQPVVVLHPYCLSFWLSWAEFVQTWSGNVCDCYFQVWLIIYNSA